MISTYIFIFLNIFNFNNVNSFLIFPLEYLQNENYKFYDDKIPDTPEKIFQQIYYKNFITKINIGKPQKNHIFLIDSNKDKFYISSITPTKISENIEKSFNFYNFPEKELYNEKTSSSYNEGICKKALQNIDHYGEICVSKEQFIFRNKDEIFSKYFPLKLVRNHDGNIPGTIGLLLNDTLFNISRSFITELKSENLIDNYYWFFDIDEISILEKKVKGNLFIGGLPHEILPDKYSIKNYKTISNYYSPYQKSIWRIKLDKIYIESNSRYDFKNTIISISYEFYNIIGSFEFHTNIKNMFMNDLIKEKKCFKRNFSQNIYTNYNMSFY